MKTAEEVAREARLFVLRRNGWRTTDPDEAAIFRAQAIAIIERLCDSTLSREQEFYEAAAKAVCASCKDGSPRAHPISAALRHVNGVWCVSIALHDLARERGLKVMGEDRP